MSKLIFIGTLHCGFTNKKELEEIILDINPDYLFVEILQKDIESNNISSYPDEMIFSLNLAKQKNIPCKGFDSEINILKENMTKEDETKIIKKQEIIIKENSWKDFNKVELNKKLDVIGEELINIKKWKQREIEMMKNIQKMIPSSGKVLVITGTGHIPFFQKKFPNAEFPLSQ